MINWDFSGKNVLVTGGARGIGKKTAIKFAEAGASVGVLDIREPEFDLNHYKIEYCKTDLAQQESCDRGMRSYFEKFGTIDCLVNNARAGNKADILEETELNWDLTLDVSLRAPFFLSLAIIKHQGHRRHPCSIINISSVVARFVSVKRSSINESVAYHVAKMGLEALTRYLAVHGGKYGIRANAIRPGFIVQDEHLERYLDNANAEYRALRDFCHPFRKYGLADDIANAALFLSSEAAQFINGDILTVDGALTTQEPLSLFMGYAQHASRPE